MCCIGLGNAVLSGVCSIGRGCAALGEGVGYWVGVCSIEQVCAALSGVCGIGRGCAVLGVGVHY